MVNVKIVDSARFLKMPVSTQALYSHLIVRGDDDGVVEAFNVMRMTGATEDDLKILVAKGFVEVLNDDLVTYISDWKEHNLLRSDRKVDSLYKDLLLKVVPGIELLPSKRQKTEPCQPNDNQMTTKCQPSIGKDSIGKDSIGNVSSVEDSLVDDSIKNIIPYQEIVNYLNLKADTKYKSTGSKTKDLIKTRFNEKFTLEDFKKVIDIKCNEWLNTDMQKYLRPETLFSNKFEGYLNQKEVKGNVTGTNNQQHNDQKQNYDFSCFE